MLRRDHKIIIDLVERGSKVIDIGCGTGELLFHLDCDKDVHGHGIEISPDKVATALANGISAIQGDAVTDLAYYPDKAFDYAILAQTMQATREPKNVLLQALRIAKKVIVVIPNFGHYSNRLYLTFKGRMPVTRELSYEWYETPNIHFCTIRDFVALCNDAGCKIEKQFYINGSEYAKPFGRLGIFHVNLFAHYGVFVLSK